MGVQRGIQYNAINLPKECRDKDKYVLIGHEHKQQEMTNDKESSKASQQVAVSLISCQTSCDDP